MSEAAPVKVLVRYPTGFSDPLYREEEVEVVSFVYGKHKDAGGYDRVGECTLAVCVSEGRFIAIPLHWLQKTNPNREQR